MFIKLGMVIAHLMFWSNAARLVLAVLVAFGSDSMDDNRLAAARYLSAATSGEAINESLERMFLALVLGILAEIGQRVVKLASKSDGAKPG